MKRAILVTIGTLLLAVIGAAQVDAPRVTQQDFKKLVASNNVLIVDTRNVDAYEISHIPGAVLLPLEGLMTWPAEYEKVAQMIQKSRKPVVTYCAWHDEFTSARAALILQQRGVKNVRALLGGWNEWVNAGNPVTKSKRTSQK